VKATHSDVRQKTMSEVPFLEKPCGAKELLAVVAKALQARTLVIDRSPT
jgi:two-component system C4-dicarboxylate transport response regulator DctD